MSAQQPLCAPILPCAPIKGRLLTVILTVAGIFFSAAATAHAQQMPQQIPDPVDAIAPPQTPSPLTLAAIGSQTFTSSSNPLLLTTGAKTLTGSTTSPELIVKDMTPASTLSFDTRVDENIFNQSTFNSTDIHSLNNFSTQNQRWTLGFQQNTDYDTTRTSELSNYALTDKAVRHTGISGTPQITYTPTAVDAFALTGSATTAHYDDASFTNYDTYAVTPSYTHHVDPLNAAVVTLQAQRYLTTDNAPNRIDSIGPTAGWTTIFTPRFTGNASIGEQASRQFASGTATGPWAWHPIYTVGLVFKGLQDNINLSATRAQYPYGDGTEALQTTYTVSEAHALNPLLTLNLSGSYLSSTYQAPAPGSPKTLISGQIGLAYHATEHLDFTTNYQYRRETLNDSGGTARDNAFMASVVYHPQLWALFE